MYTLSYSTATHCAQQAQQAAAALQQLVSNAYTVTVTQCAQYYNVNVQRVFNNYNSAVNTFNSTVQQYCNTVAQFIDSGDYPASCYVLNAEGHAVY